MKRFLPALFLLTASLNATPAFQIQARVDPAQGTIQATCKVSGWPKGAPLYLNRTFTVERLVSNGKVLPCSIPQGGAPLPFCSLSSPLEIKGELGESFEITYRGAVKEMTADVNIISSKLVELACYASWIPQSKTADPFRFTFDLSLWLPANFVVITNGEAAEARTEGGLKITRWRSQGEVDDLAVIAAPGLKQIADTQGGLRVETYFTALPEAPLRQESEALTTGYRELEALLGTPGTRGTMRYTYSPRRGWGYSRLPLVAVSEVRVQESLGKGNYSPMRSYHGGIHEVAHFWWQVADASREDWINEGLAEFTALRMSARRFGSERRMRLLASFVQDASECTTKVSILETDSKSPDRYVNHYEKTSLLLSVLEQRHGAAAMEAFLRSVYQAFKGTRTARTPEVLALLERHLSREARIFLEAGLKTQDFPLEAIRMELKLPAPKAKS